MTTTESDDIGKHRCACGHGLNWHHEEKGCAYHGYSQSRCQCFLTFDEATARYVVSAQAQVLYSTSWDIVRGAGLLPPPAGVHPAVTWLRDRADALTTPPAGSES